LIDGLSGYADELVPFRVEDGADFVCHVMYWRWLPKHSGRPDRTGLLAAMRDLGIPGFNDEPNVIRERSALEGAPADYGRFEDGGNLGDFKSVT
jgi:hypothetical protein